MKGLRILFMFLSIGLTLISLEAGYFLYKMLFGVLFAYLISIVLETLRLSSLYTFYKFKGTSAFYFGIVLYILVASLCLTVSILSFNTNIVNKKKVYDIEVRQKLEKDILLVKKAYSEKIDKQIQEIEKHKDLMMRRYAANPYSKYYPTRIKQDEEKIKKLEEKRKEFNNSSIGVDPVIWLENKSAEAGIEIDLKLQQTKDVVAETLKDLLGIDKVTFQKYFGIVLATLVEVGILLLALMSFQIKKPENHFQVFTKKNEEKNLIITDKKDVLNPIKI